LGIYAGVVLICVLALGGWEGWALGGGIATPWVWTARFSFVEGGWRRAALAAYWLACVAGAVGGWTHRLVLRARRLRGLAEGAGERGARGEDRRSAVRRDLRRKFFHALAVVMFVPGIAIDVRATSPLFKLFCL
jgi:hypothetical protein